VAISAGSGTICTGGTIPYGSAEIMLAGTSAPSCGAGSGGAESGTATPTGATTICCL
jgi:hypothetical protein